MKKFVAIVLLLALCLTACGAKELNIDLKAVYDGFSDKLPLMLELDTDERLNFMGLKAEDYTDAIVAICGDGLDADEIWLVKAKDQAALERIQKLAENRLAAKAEETETYVPDQYLVVKEAKTAVKGLYFAMLVSPEAESMKAAFEAAAK